MRGIERLAGAGCMRLREQTDLTSPAASVITPPGETIQDSAEGTDLCQKQSSIRTLALLMSPPTDLSHCFRS
jgi:hypothetical protein